MLLQTKLQQHDDALRVAFSKLTSRWMDEKPEDGNQPPSKAMEKLLAFQRQFESLQQRWLQLEDSKVRSSTPPPSDSFSYFLSLPLLLSLQSTLGILGVPSDPIADVLREVMNLKQVWEATAAVG